MKKSLSILVLFTFLSFFSFSEEIVDNDFSYSLDVPEGFTVAEYTPDGMSYRFQHEKLPVSLLLKIYTSQVCNSAEESFTRTLERLKGQMEMDKITWRNQPCIVSTFSFSHPNTKDFYQGWGLSLTLPGKDAFLVLLCYCPENVFQALTQFIISTLNSVCIDKGSYTSESIFTCYAFPKSQQTVNSINIASLPVSLHFDKDDVPALKFIIEMEFSVLKMYQNDPKWKEAWVRYYKAIWRESSARLKEASNDIYSALFPACKLSNPDNPMIKMNELLLNWVQYFPYKHENTDASDADFTDLISTMLGEGSDCDSRSLLISVLLQNMGEDTCLFVSREYSHSVYGVNFAIPGAKIYVDGKNYLLCETTAKDIAPGLIDQSQSITEKWIGILPRK